MLAVLAPAARRAVSRGERARRTKIALGHHRDDILATFFLNLFHGGQLKAMPAKLRVGRRQARRDPPARLRGGGRSRAYARAEAFPIIPCNLCGSQDNLQRQQIGEMLREWETQISRARRIHATRAHRSATVAPARPQAFRFHQHEVTKCRMSCARRMPRARTCHPGVHRMRSQQSRNMMTRRLSRFVAASSLLGLIALAGASVTDDSHSLMDDPAMVSEPVVQVWGARTLGIKGLFGVHTWIAVKPAGVPDYTVYEVIGWRLRWTDTALVARTRAPEAAGSAPPASFTPKARRGRRRADQARRQARLQYPYARNTRSGRGRTRTLSSRGSRARCPSCRPTCRPPRSARITSAAG